MKIKLMIFFGCGVIATQASALSIDNTKFFGELEVRQGWTVPDGHHSLEQYSASLGSHIEWSRDISFTAEVYTRYSDKIEKSSDTTSRFEQLHLNQNIFGCYQRLGIQTVQWGQADRLRVIDIINPMDLQESYFGDWRKKRIPLGMLNNECQFGNHSVQFLVIPETRFNEVPEAGGKFSEFSAAEISSGMNMLAIDEVSDPSTSRIDDWSTGIQWSGHLDSLTYSLNGYYGWEDQKVLSLSPSGYKREPNRYYMAGGSFSFPVDPLVIRGELAWLKDVTHYENSKDFRPLPNESSETSGLLAFDYQTGHWGISSQYYERHLDTNSIFEESTQKLVTLALNRSLMQSRLYIQAYLGLDVSNGSEYTLISADYELDQHWLLGVAAETFSGSEQGFGRFGEQDRAYFSIRYGF